MNQDQLQSLEALEADLWEAADQLRANSKLTSNEYCMPVLGVIFLRQAANRFDAVTKQIQDDQACGKAPKRPIRKEDYVRRRALYLPENARYENILALPKQANLGQELASAMKAIESAFPPLDGVLPKDYTIFERTVLEDLLRIFNRDALRAAGGDLFGRIYEYFLMKFAMQGAQDNGEFFTPPSLVQTIVNVIEPEHGIVFDPACGSGGMFVQSSHFIERLGKDTAKRVTFYGQERTATTIKLARMNLAVHGLEGDIREANTYYEDAHTLFRKCDFVMANPPFNVDMVDAEKVKGDRRLPFSLPGVNKNKKVSNGNYLWISYFHSYLNERGRAAFIMSSPGRQLYQEWFVRLRFPGHERTRTTDRVPEGWERRTLGECLTLKRGHDLPEGKRVQGTVPIVSSSGITGFHNEKKANGPGIVTGRYGTLGEVYFVEEDYWPHNTALYVCDFKGNSPRLLFYLLKHTLLNARSNNAAVPGLNRNVLHTLKVLWPSISLQKQFDAFLEPVFRQVGILRRMSTTLRSARDLLLPRLMSGEIAV
jgi:N-6 DNA Methylase/HsdM N-terminal domain/Type I restriction modification DNA specificity domain